MSEFKAIESQEELNKIIAERLARQKESIEAKYPDYDKFKNRVTELEAENGKLQNAAEQSKKDTAAQYEKTVADLNSKVAGYEKSNLRTQIAMKNGLPFDLADRLVGDDEAGIQADAERLVGLLGKQKPVPPLKRLEDPNTSAKDSAYKSLVEE